MQTVAVRRVSTATVKLTIDDVNAIVNATHAYNLNNGNSDPVAVQLEQDATTLAGQM